MQGCLCGCTSIIEKYKKRIAEKTTEQAEVIELSLDYIITRDMNCCITSWSRSAETGYGWSKEEVLGENTHRLLQTVFPVPFAIYQESLLRDGYWEGNLIHIHKNGDKVIVLSRQLVKKDEFGRPVGILEINRDITKEKRIEQEMARLARLNLVGQMAASIGHEIRNPMTTVRGFLQLLNNKENDAKNKEYFTIMIEELDRANKIISEFLAMAKNKPADLKADSLNNIIDVLYPLLQAEAFQCGRKILCDLGDIEQAMLDENEIRQLVINLVKNGLEATPENGCVTIKTFMDGHQVVLQIQDEGTGMPAQVLEKIGTPFLTTKENGTGLGLAVCYSIAGRHRAKIDIQSGAAGTTVDIRFPRLH